MQAEESRIGTHETDVGVGERLVQLATPGLEPTGLLELYVCSYINLILYPCDSSSAGSHFRSPYPAPGSHRLIETFGDQGRFSRIERGGPCSGTDNSALINPRVPFSKLVSSKQSAPTL
jgi:hypothetical protein